MRKQPRYFTYVRTRYINPEMTIKIESDDIREVWKKAYSLSRQTCQWKDNLVSFRIMEDGCGMEKYKRVTFVSELIEHNRHQFFRSMSVEN